MYNKKVLREATKNLNRTVAPAKKKDMIVDPMGQWKYPGQNTRIPSNDITMQGVPYPVWAVPNVGMPQMMYPEQDYYFPGADHVDEYPQMQKGGKTQKYNEYNQNVRYEKLYVPVVEKITNSDLIMNNWEKYPNYNTGWMEYILSGPSKDRNMPPETPLLKEMQQKILALPSSEIDELLKVNWSGAGLPTIMYNRPSNVSVKDMWKYYNHLNYLKNQGYTLEEGGDISIPQLNQYEDGGEYDLTQEEIDDLIAQGYQVEDVDTDEYKKGGTPRSLPKKKSSKAYSRSLTATNKLFAESNLTKKTKSRKNKFFDPTSKYYQFGGQDGPRVEEEKPVEITRENLNNIYPAFRNLGDVELTADPNFTSKTSGLGSIEYISPERGDEPVRYPSGYELVAPKPGVHNIVYDPNTNNINNVKLDLFTHGLRDSDPTYQKYLKEFTDAYNRSPRAESMRKWYAIDEAEGYAPDGREAYENNWIDGDLRGIFHSGTYGQKIDEHYNPNQYEQTTAGSPELVDKIEQIRKYIETPHLDYLEKSLQLPKNKKGGFQDDLGKHRKLLRDWTYGASIGMLHKAQEGLDTGVVESKTPWETAPEGFSPNVYEGKDVTVKAQGPEWARYQREYQNTKSWEDFLYGEQQKYLRKHKGLNKAAGVSMDNFPEAERIRIKQKYDEKMNNYVTRRLGQNFGFNPNRRGEWVDFLTDKQKEIVAGSKYGSKLQPDVWSKFLSGLRSTANLINPTQHKITADIPGYTEAENKEALQSWLEPLETFSFLDVLGIAIANKTKNMNTENPSWYSGEMMSNVDENDAMAVNPLTLLDLYALPHAAVSLGRGVAKGSKAIGRGIKTAAGSLGTGEGKLSKAFTTRGPIGEGVGTGLVEQDISKAVDAVQSKGLTDRANIKENLLATQPAFDKVISERVHLLQTPEGQRRLQNFIDQNKTFQTLQDLNKGVTNVRAELKPEDYVEAVAGTEQVEQILNDAKTYMSNLRKDYKKGFVTEAQYNKELDRYNNLQTFLENQELNAFQKGRVDDKQANLISIGQGFGPEEAVTAGRHEVTHILQNEEATHLDNELSSIDLIDDADLPQNTYVSNDASAAPFSNNVLSDPNYYKKAKNYWSTGSRGREKIAFAEDVRSDMLERGIIKNLYDEVTPEMLEAYYKEYTGNRQGRFPLRIFDIMKADPKNFKILSNVINKMPIAIPAAVGIGAAATQGESPRQLGQLGPQKFKKGGNLTKAQSGLAVMNYLIDKGLTKEQAAGIAGNIQQESGFSPKARSKSGYIGIAQWDPKNRWPAVEKYIKSQGYDPMSLEGQLEGLYWEANKRGNWKKIAEAQTPEQASAAWLKHFEISGEKPGMAGYNRRVKYANDLASSYELPMEKQIAFQVPPVAEIESEDLPIPSVEIGSLQTRPAQQLAQSILPSNDIASRYMANNNFQYGGDTAYEDLDLTPAEIDWYLANGYDLEDLGDSESFDDYLPEAQSGFVIQGKTNVVPVKQKTPAPPPPKKEELVVATKNTGSTSGPVFIEGKTNIGPKKETVLPTDDAEGYFAKSPYAYKPLTGFMQENPIAVKQKEVVKKEKALLNEGYQFPALNLGSGAKPPSLTTMPTNQPIAGGIGSQFTNIGKAGVIDQNKLTKTEKEVAKRNKETEKLKEVVQPGFLEKVLESQAQAFTSGPDIYKASDEVDDLLQQGKNYFSRQSKKNSSAKEPSVKPLLDNKESIEQTAIITGDPIYLNNRRYYTQEVIDLNSVKLGYRNRGEYKNLDTEAGNVTAFNPFLPKKNMNLSKIKSTETFIGIDKNGKFKTGTIDKFNSDDLISKTFSNKIVDFVYNPDGSIKLEKRNKDNPNNPVPVVRVIENGKEKLGSLNFLTKSGMSDPHNQYGEIQGGRIILKAGNKTLLVSGSINDVVTQFKKLKEQTKEPIEIITLDNGSYNLGIRTKDKKITVKDLKEYDNLNNSGGNFLYLMLDKPTSGNTSFKPKSLEDTKKIKTQKDIPDFSNLIDSPTARYFKNEVIDKKYVYGMSTDPLLKSSKSSGKGLPGEKEIDCSGAVCKVLTKKGLNIGDPTVNNSAQHFYDRSTPVKWADMKDGDLITMKTTDDKVDHIGFIVIDKTTGKRFIAESSRSFNEGRIVPFKQRIEFLQNYYPNFKYSIRRL